MKSVKFLRSHKMYQPGETAGFDDKVAEGLISSGVAVDPAKKREAAEETADVLVNPGSFQADAEVELQTRVQASIDPAGAVSQDKAGGSTDPKPTEAAQQASEPVKPKTGAKTAAKKG